MSTGELACTYASLILYDDDIEITADKIQTLVDAAGVKIEPYWPGLFARLAESTNIGDLISSIGSVGGGAPAPAPAAGGGGGGGGEGGQEEEKKEEEEEEEEMEFDLFD